MTHDPGDAPVPDPDDRRAPAVAPPDADVRETPTGAGPPAEVTASDAGRGGAAGSDVGRPEAPESGVGRPESAPSEVGWPGAAASDVGRPEVAGPDVGWPGAAASDVGRPESAGPDVGWPGAAASDVGRPESAGSDEGRREVRAADVGRPEVAAPGVAASERTASDVADPAAAGGGALTTNAPDGYAPGDGPPAPRTGRDAQPVEDAPPAGRDASAGWSAPSVLPGAVPGSDPSPSRRPAQRRPVPDPYETTRLPVTPTPDPRFADTPPRSAGDPSAAPPNRPGGTRIGAALFFDDRLADGQSTTHPHEADDASGRAVVDDAPTEAMAVVDAGGRHRAEPGGDTDADPGTEWRPPRQTSRLTTVLVIALLVAIGFLAGVFVGRSAAPAPSAEQPRPAATSPARPGALR